MPPPTTPKNSPPTFLRRTCITLLGAGVAVLCVTGASFLASFGIAWSTGLPLATTIHSIEWNRGRIGWQRFEILRPGTTPIETQLTFKKLPSAPWNPTLTPGSLTSSITRMNLPFWLPLLPFAFPAAYLARSAYRARLRELRGCCRNCEYNLKGLGSTNGPTICPECGTPKPR